MVISVGKRSATVLSITGDQSYGLKDTVNPLTRHLKQSGCHVFSIAGTKSPWITSVQDAHVLLGDTESLLFKGSLARISVAYMVPDLEIHWIVYCGFSYHDCDCVCD